MSVQSVDVRHQPAAPAGSAAPGAGIRRWARAGRWAIRAVAGLVAFLVAAAAAGAVYQALAAWTARRTAVFSQRRLAEAQ
jgi:hypothetical protein